MKPLICTKPLRTLAAAATVAILSMTAQAEAAAPYVAGDYDTAGRGRMHVRQVDDKITLTWHSRNGTSVLDATWKKVRFRTENVSRLAFYGVWVLKDDRGRMIRWGEAAVFVEPAFPNHILIRSWEHATGDWRPSVQETFKRISPPRLQKPSPFLLTARN